VGQRGNELEEQSAGTVKCQESFFASEEETGEGMGWMWPWSWRNWSCWEGKQDLDRSGKTRKRNPQPEYGFLVEVSQPDWSFATASPSCPSVLLVAVDSCPFPCTHRMRLKSAQLRYSDCSRDLLMAENLQFSELAK